MGSWGCCWWASRASFVRDCGLAALLGSVVACGGVSTLDGSTSNTPSAGATSQAGCPAGYPYCATLDACLLPDHSCPPVAMSEPGDAGPAAGGNTSSEDPDAAPPNSALPLPSTPDKIRCGADLCDAVNGYCCSDIQSSSNFSGATFDTCSATFCPFRRECDETADCTSGEVCCYSVVASPPAVLASSCVPSGECAYDGAWVACGSQADCSNAGAPPCMAQQCAGATLQACGPISHFACKNR